MTKNSVTLEIINKRGLHARASSKFAVLAQSFDNTEILVSKDDQEVSADSIMDLMMLAAGIGSSITINAEGENAEAAIKELSDLVNNKFGEEE